jgi:hypothetical protein
VKNLAHIASLQAPELLSAALGLSQNHATADSRHCRSAALSNDFGMAPGLEKIGRRGRVDCVAEITGWTGNGEDLMQGAQVKGMGVRNGIGIGRRLWRATK